MLNKKSNFKEKWAKIIIRNTSRKYKKSQWNFPFIFSTDTIHGTQRRNAKELITVPRLTTPLVWVTSLTWVVGVTTSISCPVPSFSVHLTNCASHLLTIWMAPSRTCWMFIWRVLLVFRSDFFYIILLIRNHFIRGAQNLQIILKSYKCPL